jgi:hypothetical protein
MPIGLGTAVLGAGALSAVGGVIGSGMAADAQTSAAQTAANTQLSMYNQTRGDLLPYSQGGQSAFSNLQSLLGMGGQPNFGAMNSALQNYPGYQFAMDQGVQALDRSAASRGTLLSGGQLKDLTAYGQGMGSQLFNRYFDQNYQLASLGENAAAQTGNAGSNAASGAASAQMAGGTAAASGIMGATNAATNGIGNALINYSILNGGAGGGGGMLPYDPNNISVFGGG